MNFRNLGDFIDGSSSDRSRKGSIGRFRIVMGVILESYWGGTDFQRVEKRGLSIFFMIPTDQGSL